MAAHPAADDSVRTRYESSGIRTAAPGQPRHVARWTLTGCDRPLSARPWLVPHRVEDVDSVALARAHPAATRTE